uniref:Regulatory protein zeste n=1 Tax=Glossina morsitans morsitans TaxID=37546 RepID=A0A1B0F9D6_GLOMM
MEKSRKKAKFERATKDQLSFYIEFCQQHPELLAGRSQRRSMWVIQNLWRELAKQLNAMRGPTRSPTKWRETLAVWKCQLRTRARLNQGEVQMIADSSENSRSLSELALKTFGTDASGIEHCDVSETKQVIDGEITRDLDECKDPLLAPNADIRPASVVSLESTSSSQGAASFKPASPAESLSPLHGNVLDLIIRRFKRTDVLEKQILEAQLATAQAINKLSDSLLVLAKAIGKLDK